MNSSWIGLSAALLLISTSAWADVAPPPSYEEECTRAQVEAADEYCQLVSAYYADPNGCLEQELDGLSNAPADASACSAAGTSPSYADCCQVWIDAGYTQRCQTYGASAYQTMWCRERRDGDPAAPVSESESSGDDDGGCSIGTVGRTGPPAFVLLIAFGVLGGLRRRRRSA